MERRRQLLLARVISLVFSPLVWIVPGVGQIFWRAFTKGVISNWEMVGLMTVTLFLPLVFFFISVKRGRLDFDLTERKKRFRFYVFGIGCGFLGMNLAYLFSDYLFKLLLVFTFTGLAFMIITFWDKVSLHVGGWTSFYLVLNLLNDWHYFYLLPIIFGVGWARVTLGRHTRLEVVEAFIIPWLTILSGFYFLRPV